MCMSKISDIQQTRSPAPLSSTERNEFSCLLCAGFWCACDVTRSLAVESTHPHSKSSKGETKGNKSFFINLILSFLKPVMLYEKLLVFFLLFQHNNNNNRSRKTRCAKFKKKKRVFFCSFQGRLSCRFAMKQLTTPEMNCNSQVDVTDDDGEYLLMSLFPLEIFKKKKKRTSSFGC